MRDYTYATPEFFVSWSQGDILDGFTLPYLNDVASRPTHFLALEAVYFGMGLFTFVRALQQKRVSIWIGFFIWGIILETVGFVIKSHLHGQFVVQLFPFLPLKEVVWYPVVLYPSYETAKGVRFSDKYGAACLFGLLAILTDVPYEMTNGRDNVGVAHINYNCETGPLALSNRFL
mmetsp:Transcript_15395/g.20234  ORF Transcript_15395/g.20234 Transcript_15395/m.20234 type:complete len:175 (-) Transcript_15395:798-1322(-)